MVGGRGRDRPPGVRKGWWAGGGARAPGGRSDGQAGGRMDGRTGRRTAGWAGWLIDGRPGKRMGGQDGLQTRRTDGRTDGQSWTAGPVQATRMQNNLKEDNSLIHSLECVDPPVDTWR
jgi:hypothetical protein